MALDWDLVGVPTSSQGRALAWSPHLSKFVLLGESVYFSTDGINWIEGTATDYHLTTGFVAKGGVIWNQNLLMFIAVCSSNSPVFTTILTSTDGETWTTRTSDIDLQRGIAYEPVTGFTVVVGENGQCTTSADGINWSSAGVDLVGVDASADWQRVVWNSPSSLFVAVADVGNVRIATSPDGINWTGRHGFEPAKQSTWGALAVNPNNGHMLAIASTGSVAMRSDDGITWEDKYFITLMGADTCQYARVIWSEILSTFITIATNDSDMQGQVLLNPTGEDADWTLDSLIPDTVVVSGSAWEWEELVESVELGMFVAGNENESDEPLATSLTDDSEITGDQELEIEDASLLSLGNEEILGDLTLGIQLGEVHEIYGDLTLEIELIPRTVWSSDASGLYILVHNKTNDTIYDREGSEDTQDVNIPDPILGTAYVGG